MGHHPQTLPRTDGCTETRVALRPKQEAFSQRFAEHGNATRAYREAFECGPTMSPATVRQRAYELVHTPAVAARVREIMAVAAEGTTISARARMVRLQDIVESDPAELVRIVAEPCRYCHGAGHAFQWIDEREFATACDEAIAEKRPWPDMSGGFDFNPTLEPAPDCPRCFGRGVPCVIVTPTDQLSPAGRRLLKGVRQKANGEIEVKMHDQLAAADMLNKMQGVYVDRSVSITARIDVPALEKLSPEQALDYLERLRPTRPALPAAIDATFVDVSTPATEPQDAAP